MTRCVTAAGSVASEGRRFSYRCHGGRVHRGAGVRLPSLGEDGLCGDGHAFRGRSTGVACRPRTRHPRCHQGMEQAARHLRVVAGSSGDCIPAVDWRLSPPASRSRAVQGRRGSEHRARQAAAVRAGYGRGGRHVVRARPERKLARHRGVFLEGPAPARRLESVGLVSRRRAPPFNRPARRLELRRRVLGGRRGDAGKDARRGRSCGG